ncbi:hypothetical protein [Streptomyces sp. NPDC088348]|uniref:hypothetical protein n=1 Tax=Streptomyces sp. NPDC088348 TaxID=3365853 RepID=UPI00381D8BCC
MTQPEPYTYTDPTDAFGHTLTVAPVDASTYDGTIPVVSLGIQVPADATDPENPIVYVPLADVEEVVAAIRAAAGQPEPSKRHSLGPADGQQKMRLLAELRAGLTPITDEAQQTSHQLPDTTEASR